MEKSKKRSSRPYLIISLVAAAAIILFILWSSNVFLTSYERYYAGDVRHFRGNLDEAAKVPVYPDETSLVNVLLNPEVYRIKIAFIPNDTENSFYFASSFEITNKMSIIFRSILGVNVTTFKTEDGSSCLMFHPDEYVRCFISVPINSTDELTENSMEPVILLLGPSNANSTAIYVDNNTVILEGKSFEEVDRTYTDLDLTVDKMLIVLMDRTST
jgi:hypothetical protein